MSGIRKCAECGKLFRIQNAGPEAMRSDGTFPRHVCPRCRGDVEAVIVKVQISLNTTEPERQVLINNEDRSLLVILPLSACPGLEDQMADLPLPRAFFEAEIVGDKVHLGERLEEQGW